MSDNKLLRVVHVIDNFVRDGVNSTSDMNKNNRTNVRHSDQDKTLWVTLVEEKIKKEGLSIRRACQVVSEELTRQTGRPIEVHPSVFNWWRAKMQGKPYTPSKKRGSGRLEKQLQSFTVPIMDPGVTNSPVMTTSEKRTVRVTVREYTLEGDHEEVMHAIKNLKNDD